jgi:hypothetical protein
MNTAIPRMAHCHTDAIRMLAPRNASDQARAPRRFGKPQAGFAASAGQATR